MLVKTGKVAKNGKEIYLNKLTGQEGTLPMFNAGIASRYQRRHPIGVTSSKVLTNRKRTKGRHVHYQTINFFDKIRNNIGVKIIKHIQETANAIFRKSLMMEKLIAKN